MANLAKRHVPVVCQVAFIKALKNGGYRVEGTDCKLYQFKSNQQVTRLISVTTDIDNLKPAPPPKAMTFQHVSID